MNPDTERKMVLKQKPISPIDRLQHIIKGKKNLIVYELDCIADTGKRIELCKKVILKDIAEIEALEMAIEKLKEEEKK